MEYTECQSLPTRGLTFSWLQVGRDSPRRTLVTSMIIMGNLSENRLKLAEGIVKHVAVFAPSLPN